jgi:hypothetical protein
MEIIRHAHERGLTARPLHGFCTLKDHHIVAAGDGSTNAGLNLRYNNLPKAEDRGRAVL